MTTSHRTTGGAQGAVDLDEPAGHQALGHGGLPALARPAPPACVPEPCPPPVGESWILPDGPGCAHHARAVLAEALAMAGASRAVIGDAQLMVSELATNAFQHARDHGPHEMWLYPCLDPALPELAAQGGAAGEARCAIFDRYFGARLPGYSWTSGDYGRGLSIVEELSEGRWGLLRTFSRGYPRSPGKAVWFAIPVVLRLPDPPVQASRAAG